LTTNDPVAKLDNLGIPFIMSKLISEQNKKILDKNTKPLSPVSGKISLEEYRQLTALADAPKGRASKYNAKKTEVDGIVFDSVGESKRYLELKVLERIGDISDLKLQQSHKLFVGDVLICTYRSDFEYLNKQGDVVIEDFKGVRTPEYKIKRNLMLALKGVTIYETGASNSNKGKK
jgi:hypothetical protein